MNAKQFLNKHNGIIIDALDDYQRWSDEGEDNYESCKEALKDFDEVTDL